MCSVEWIYSELVNIAFEEEERKRRVAALTGAIPAPEPVEPQPTASAHSAERKVPLLARLLATVFRSNSVGYRA